MSARYPVLHRPSWAPEEILEAGKRLKRLPPADHEALGKLFDLVPARKAIATLKTLAGLPAGERAAIYAQAQSADGHERDKALARALGLPPPLDPAVPHVQRARDELRRAATTTHEADLGQRCAAVAADVVVLLNRLIERTGGHPL